LSEGWTQEGALTQARTILHIANGLRKQIRDTLPPAAFLLLDSDTGKDVIVLPDLGELPSKEERSRYIRTQAQRHGAKYVALVSEAWVVAAASADEQLAVQAWLHAGYALRDYPDARDQLVCSLDGPGLSRVFHAVIGPEGEMGEIVETSNPVAGRMTNLSGRLGEN